MILRDPVHDLVSFETTEEQVVVDLLGTSEVQRLRRIRQLGVSHFVFPGAEHSRFTHAIGTAHVMTRMIRRLRSLDDELPFWQRLASDRAREALAAALLHDLGHGPYSHLFEQAIPGAPHHETWSLQIVLDSGTEVHQTLRSIDPSLPEAVASLIHPAGCAKPHPLPYLAHAVSGTFDVDRCDYLLRDAYMTGVRYGLFDLDWLLRSLRFTPSAPGRAPRFAIDGFKGLPAIEGFVLGRRFMYEQVYLHKAARAAEVMIRNILARAARAINDGTWLDAVPRALLLAARGEPIPLGAYLALDDVTLGAAMSTWEDGSDPVLSDFCRRLRRRHLHKTVDVSLLGEADVASLVDDARTACRVIGLDPEAHVTLDLAEDGLHLGGPPSMPPSSQSDANSSTYGSGEEVEPPLEVMLGDGRARPLGQVSVVLAKLDGAPLRRLRLVVPPEIRDQIRGRVASLEPVLGG